MMNLEAARTTATKHVVDSADAEDLQALVIALCDEIEELRSAMPR